MLKKFLLAGSLLLSFSLLNNVFASHIACAEIFYKCVDPVAQDYEVKVSLCTDCAGFSLGTSTTLCVTSVNANYSQSITINQLPCPPSTVPGGLPCEVSQVCVPLIGSTTCGTGSNPGYLRQEYVDTINLPSLQTDWTFSWNLCCRNNAIINLTGASGLDTYVESTLDNTIGCNTSPSFTNLGIYYMCVNEPTAYSQGVIEPDGDSLVFSMVAPFDLVSGCPFPSPTPANFNFPWSAVYPLTTLSGTFPINQNTGDLGIYTPTATGAYALAVLCEEYRNGQLIGTVLRDMQFVVVSLPGCSGTIPPDPGQIAVSNGSIDPNDSLRISVCPGDTLEVNFIMTGDTLTVTANNTLSIPGSTFDTTQIDYDTVAVKFTWAPTAADVGSNVFTITLQNKTCPIVQTLSFGYTIDVLQGTTVGQDINYCPTGGPIVISAIGGQNFQWVTVSGDPNGIDCDTCAVVIASPDSNSVYAVTSDLTGTCKNTDTINVFLQPNFNYTIGAVDDTICVNGNTDIFVDADTANAPYTISWTPNTTLSDDSSLVVNAFPVVSTTYIADIISANNCRVVDSVRVTVDAFGPLIEIKADKNFVCPGDTITLTGSASSLYCGLNQDPNGFNCFTTPGGTFLQPVLGTGFNTTTVTSPFDDAWAKRVQYLYTAAELSAAGFSSGTITAIEFEVLINGTQQYNQFEVKIGCTPRNNIGSSFHTGLTSVYGPTTHSVIGTGFSSTTISLNDFFNWDGLTNIIIEVCYLNSSFGSQNVCAMTTTAHKSVLWDDGFNQSCSQLIFDSKSSDRPNTRFTVCDYTVGTPTLNWTPDGSTCDNCPITKVAVNNDFTMNLSAADPNGCVNDGSFDLRIDSSYYVAAFPSDTAICANDTIIMTAITFGDPPKAIGACDTNANFICTNFNNFVQGEIGTALTFNGTTTYPNIFGNWFEGAKHQIIYRASELTAAGLGIGTITGVELNIAALSTAGNFHDFTIHMGCTSIDQFQTSFLSGLKQVLYDSVVTVAGTGPKTLTLDIPYDWDGVSNLVVEFCYNNAPYLNWTQNHSNYYTATTWPSVLVEFADNDNDLCQNPQPPAQSTERPNTKFIMCLSDPATVDYKWTPNFNIDIDTGVTVKAYPGQAQEYVVEATYVNGCIRRDTVRITLDTFPYSLTMDDSICGDSSINLLFTGGVSYEWSPGGTLNDSTIANPVGSPSGDITYSVTATDVDGCEVRDSVVVAVRPDIIVDIGNDTMICPGASIILDPGSFQTYDWSTAAGTQTIVAMNTGTYDVTVNDGNCNYISNTLNLTNFALPPLPFGPTASVCEGEDITLNAQPGYPSYTWTPGGQTTSSITISNAQASDAGVYQYTIEDFNGCTVISDPLTLSVEARPVPNLSNNQDSVCVGDILILDAGSEVGVTYSWSNGATGNPLNITTEGQFVVFADRNGCVATDTIFVTQVPIPAIDLGPANITICCGSMTLQPGPDVHDYMWFDGNTSHQYIAWGSGLYSVTATNDYGCTASESIDIEMLCLNPMITFEPDNIVNGNQTVSLGDSATLCVSTGYNNGSIVYQWLPIDNSVLSPNDSCTVVVPQQTTTYIVVVTDLANLACIPDTAQVLVVVSQTNSVALPRAFSPNGDDLNDEYYPIAINTFLEVNEFRIYNRWGDLLHSDATEGWDGTVEGAQQPIGNYIYYISYTIPDAQNPGSNKTIVDHGTFSLLR